MKIVEYLTTDGTSPFRNWFDDLDSRSAAKVTTALLHDGPLDHRAEIHFNVVVDKLLGVAAKKAEVNGWRHIMRDHGRRHVCLIQFQQRHR